MSRAYDQAKQFFEEEWNDEPIKIHSACVIDCCVNMSKNTSLDPTVFEIAGWLHDVGRKDDADSHNEISLLYLDKFLEEHPEYSPLKIEISDCVLNHRRAQKPKTVYGRIMQAADKASKFHNDWIAYSNHG